MDLTRAMGEQVNKEEAKVVEAEKKEEAAAPAEAEEEEEEPEEKKEEAAGGGEEEKKEEEAAKPPSPPPPVILAVDLHCTGCAKRIKRSILRCKGVEGVEVDMGGNQVTVKGIVDPQALCARVQKKTMRKATVVSPLPPPPPLVHSQVSEVRTVELLVNMHCDACAEQLQKKILKMIGVQTAETNLGAGKLTVTGTMTDDKIVEYIHRRTGKLATVVPPPSPPEPPKEEAAGEKQDDEGEKEKPAPEADKKEEKPAEDDANKKSEEQADEAAAKDDSKEAAADDKHKEEELAKQEEEGVVADGFPPEEVMRRMVYWPYGGGGYMQYPAEEVMMAMNTMPHPAYATPQWMPPPVYYSNYMVERPAPAPQLFSDENPNACVIS